MFQGGIRHLGRCLQVGKPEVAIRRILLNTLHGHLEVGPARRWLGNQQIPGVHAQGGGEPVDESQFGFTLAVLQHGQVGGGPAHQRTEVVKRQLPLLAVVPDALPEYHRVDRFHKLSLLPHSGQDRCFLSRQDIAFIPSDDETGRIKRRVG